MSDEDPELDWAPFITAQQKTIPAPKPERCIRMDSATTEVWQQVSTSISPLTEETNAASRQPIHHSELTKLWMLTDTLSVVIAAGLATMGDHHLVATQGGEDTWRWMLHPSQSIGSLGLTLGGFTILLLIVSRRLHLYSPTLLSGHVKEQILSMQACLTAGLLLTGLMDLTHADAIPRSFLLSTMLLVMLALGSRRLIYRVLLHRRFERGVSTRNAIILGSGPAAEALRHQLETVHRLGYRFKGFVDLQGGGDESATGGEVVKTPDHLFQQVRRHFIDEIFFFAPRDKEVLQEVLDQSRMHGVNLRMVPDLLDGHAWSNPVEHIGKFPTIPLHCGVPPKRGMLLKRMLDVFLGMFALTVLSPVMLAIAIAIRVDSPGPIFYCSERIGKRGNVFRCRKFRTMVDDADKRLAEIIHMNERDGVLFKITNDPRVTRVGRVLRKYSLDELPQFLNVLEGDMSIVGPRPPLASEVVKYDLSHLRRLDVTPGITGLWQVEARQDPSFESYIALDVAYIDSWSIWLDLRIIARTIGVVFAGTGS